MSEPQVVKNLNNNKQEVEYLTFRLGEEDYGVDILRVREIRGWDTVTRIPNSPKHVKGVLNLRGSIVPIVDLRIRLGMEIHTYSKDTVVIVLHVNNENTQRNIGIVVDEVSDVLKTNLDGIRNAPQLGAGIPVEYINGLVDADGKMVMLLDVDRLLNNESESEQNDVDAA